MKLVVKRNRELAPINSQNTQNENRAETIELVVPEEYESFNKKIVFITPNETVWDVIVNNQYKITNAITKYDKVDYYIWLTKEVDGESIDFRTKTKTLNFYHNEDASDEITDEEIHGVNTVVNLLEEEIEKVENLNIEATKIGSTTTVTITKKDGTTESVEINDGTDGQDGQDGYTPQKGIDYFTEQDIEEIETDVKEDVLDEVYTKSETDTLLQEKADVEDIPDVSSFITKDVNNLTNYTLKTNTGSLIDLEINDTTYVVTLKLKNQDGTVISTDTIDLPLESVVVSGRYDNTTKKVILTLENGSEVDFSVADLVAGLQTEITSQNKLASDLVDDTNSGNKFVTTSEKQTWNNKLDESDLTDYVKNTDYATALKAGIISVPAIFGAQTYNGYLSAIIKNYNDYGLASDNMFIGKGTLENVIAGKQLINQTQLEESQATQDEEIEKLKATLPTTTGEGQDITLDKTAELEFKKPPLPMGNSEQKSTNGTNLIGLDTEQYRVDLSEGDKLTITNNTSEQIIMDLYSNYGDTQKNDWFSFVANDTRTITLLHDTKAIAWRNAINGIAWCNSGETALPYEKYTGGQASPNPDYPQEITNVTGDVEVKVQNKNLFDKDNATSKSNYIKDDNGNDASTGGFSYITSYTKVNSNTTYTLSGKLVNNNGTARIYYYDKNKNWISRSAGFGVNVNVCTFTTPQNCEYIQFQYINEAFDIDTIQLEKNSTSTTYTPHKEQTFTFPLGNEKLMLGDYLADDGIHHVRGQVVFDGSENWLANGESTDYGQYVYLLNTKAYGTTNLISDKFLTKRGNDGNYISGRDANKYIAISIAKNIVTYGANQFKTWLSTHNVTVEYELEEEVIVPYTSAQQRVYNEIKNAYSYDEITIITGSSDGNKPFFTVQTYKDLNKELNNKVDKVQGKELSSNDFTDTLKEKLEGLENYDDTEIKADISGKQDKTDNNLSTINKTITGAINEVDSIAKGANQALSYGNYSTMITAFNSLANDVYNIGQNVMIITLEVPDLWISGIESTSSTYTYTTDEAITTALSTNGYIQVGYYKLSALETQKVDLTDYATKTYVNNLFNSIVDGDEVSY